jgi:hypothetical protein
MVGAGSVVTRPLPAHALAAGNPARLIGWVCRCGNRLVAAEGDTRVGPWHDGAARCPADGLRYVIQSGERCDEEPA